MQLNKGRTVKVESWLSNIYVNLNFSQFELRVE